MPRPRRTQDALDAVSAAERAWPAWAALPVAERIDICLKALETLPNDLDERAEVLSRENGKIRFEAVDRPAGLRRALPRGGQVRDASSTPPETIAGPPYNTTIRHVPQGVVTIIYPFNWPLAILAASLPHALMAGNTVIAKPPPTTPLSSVLTLRQVAQKLPPGVLNVVTGQDAVLGPVVVGDPRVKHVCFTGSTAGGKRIMEMASKNVTNVTLELGGNDPAIVLDDAVLDEGTIMKMALATFMTTGQVCMALKRLYVPTRPVRPGGRRAARLHRGSEDRCRPEPRCHDGPAEHAPPARLRRRSCWPSRAPSGTEVIDGGEYVDADPSEGNFMKPALVLDPSADRADRHRGTVRTGAADHPLRQRG